MTHGSYHYTECGLDNVYLDDGFEMIDGEVTIKDIRGLHEAIGRALALHKPRLSGSEIRFLRVEMLMSQATIAKLLRVSEQAVARWEKGKSEVPGPAEAIIRGLYVDHIKDDSEMSKTLRERLRYLADLEHEMDKIKNGKALKMGKGDNDNWRVAPPRKVA